MPNAQIALAWLLRQKGVASPIVGATKMQHLDDAIAALSVKLSNEEVRLARGAVRAARDRRLRVRG